MRLTSLLFPGVLVVSLAGAACEKSSAGPTGPSEVTGAAPGGAAVTDAATGVTIGAPQLVSPADNAQFKNVEQPVTLTIKNGLTTGTTPLTYTFEVARDPGFANKVYTRDVPEAAGGQTALKIDKIAPATTYYWRVRSTLSGTGPYSRVRSFAIGPEVILQTPILALPAQNATVSGSPVTLTVNNVGRSGPAERIMYRFELSDTSSFANLIFVSTVPEQGGAGGRTSVQAQLPNVTGAVTYYWRVQASDPPNGVTTPYSNVGSFKYQPFDMHQATIWDNPPDLADWAETTKITSIIFTDIAFEVDFDKRQSPDKWPESGFGSGGIQYTLGMCGNINNHWHCSAVVQLWDGRELSASGCPMCIAQDWFYDSRWGALQGFQPAPGEIVGIFVAQGNLRGSGNTSVKERSNVVLIPWLTNYQAAAFRGGRLIR